MTYISVPDSKGRFPTVPPGDYFCRNCKFKIRLNGDKPKLGGCPRCGMGTWETFMRFVQPDYSDG